jgi:hypothetical protein
VKDGGRRIARKAKRYKVQNRRQRERKQRDRTNERESERERERDEETERFSIVALIVSRVR